MRDEAQLLRAWENIVRRGRARGLGMTLITQRSASINKNGPDADRHADRDAHDGAAGPGGRRGVGQVPRREGGASPVAGGAEERRGLGLVAALPEAHGARADAAARATFDSGATPSAETKRARHHATLADVNLGEIKTKMAATIERAKADDPRELRAEVAKLRAELTKKPQPAAPTTKEKRIEVPVLRESQVKRVETIVHRFEKMNAKTQAAIMALAKAAAEAMVEGAVQVRFTADRLVAKQRIVHAPPPAATRTVTAKKPRATEANGGEMDGAKQAILDTVAMLNVRGIDVRRESVARWLDLHPTGGRFTTNLGWLRAQGYLEGFMLTDKGQRAAREMPTGLDAALQALSDEAKRNIIRALLDAKKAVSREELAAMLSLHPTGGRFTTNLGWLRTMGIITERGPITVTDGLTR
jgi:hypothetical protein